MAKYPKSYINRPLKVFAYVPVNVTEAELAGYIMDALESNGGSRHPEDPLFHSFSVQSVRMRGLSYKNPAPKEIPPDA